MSWAISAPTLFTIPQTVSTLSAGDRREVCNDRKRGVLPGGQQANFVGKGGYSGSSGAGPSRPGGSGGPGSRDLTRMQCYRCNQYGHLKSDCPTRPPMRCHGCNQTGHKLSQCGQQRQGGGGRSAGQGSGSPKPKCRYCDKLGHTLIECMKRRSDLALAALDANLRDQA